MYVCLIISVTSLGCGCPEHLMSSFLEMAANIPLEMNACFYRFMVGLKEEQSKEYLNKVTAMAQRAECQVNIVTYSLICLFIFLASLFFPC